MKTNAILHLFSHINTFKILTSGILFYYSVVLMEHLMRDVYPQNNVHL